MHTEKISFALSLGCAALSGFLMFLARTLSAPLWLVLALACLLTFFLYFAAGLFHTGSGRYQQLDPAAEPLQKYTLVVAALCFFLAALLRLPQFIRDGMIFSMLLIVAPLFAAIACGFRLLVGESHRRSGPAAMVPTFFLCAQLLCFYRANSYHPDTEAFGYEIIVLSLLLMGVYLTASSKYKPRAPHVQRFWALLPLAGCAMELYMLLFAAGQLYRAEDMNAATLLGMAGAGALLLSPLLFPIQPVSVPEDPAPAEDAEATELTEAAEPAQNMDVTALEEAAPENDA